MNRWIDADELKNKVLEWMPLDPCGIVEKEFPFETDIVVSLMMEIEEAPTIEPKQGKWKADFADNGWKDISCSECGWKKNVDVHVTLGYNFCPNCGVRMKGADND